MAAKCNITGLVIEKLSKLHWGFKCKDNGCAIIENYLEYLNCSNINLVVCNPGKDCSDVITSFNCNFNILSISATLNPIGEEADIIFDLQVVNYVGGRTPFTYQWEFDSDDFDIIGSDTDPQIKLKLKEGKVLELLVSEIIVSITDADGCTDEKSCWLTPEGLECNINFVPCNNPANMVVNYEYVACSKPKSVVVINTP